MLLSLVQYQWPIGPLIRMYILPVYIILIFFLPFFFPASFQNICSLALVSGGSIILKVSKVVTMSTILRGTSKYCALPYQTLDLVINK